MSILLEGLSRTDNESPFDGIADSLIDVYDYIGTNAAKLGLHDVNLLVVGGAALHSQGLREKFQDIDILIKESNLVAALPSSLIHAGEMSTEIEFCFNYKLGGLIDNQMFERGRCVQTAQVKGVNISCSIYPEEYYLLFKMEFGKEKCLGDIQNMLMTIPHDKILKAFNNLADCNEEWVMDDIAGMLSTDYMMLMHTGKSNNEALRSIVDMISGFKISDEKMADIKEMIYSVSECSTDRSMRKKSKEDYALSV